MVFVIVLMFLLFGGGPKSQPVFIQEDDKNVLLKSVMQHGAIDEYKITNVRPIDAGGLPDGVFLLTIQTDQDKPEPILTSCILIKDVVGYKEAAYALGMLDCDGYPDLRRPDDKIELTPLSTGDIFEDIGKGFYTIEVPANVIPGYTKPIKCFAIIYPQGYMGVFNGYSGMSCAFGQKTASLL